MNLPSSDREIPEGFGAGAPHVGHSRLDRGPLMKRPIVAVLINRRYIAGARSRFNLIAIIERAEEATSFSRSRPCLSPIGKSARPGPLTRWLIN